MKSTRLDSVEDKNRQVEAPWTMTQSDKAERSTRLDSVEDRNRQVGAPWTMTPVEYQIMQRGAPDWTVLRTETDRLELHGP